MSYMKKSVIELECKFASSFGYLAFIIDGLQEQQQQLCLALLEGISNTFPDVKLMKINDMD